MKKLKPKYITENSRVKIVIANNPAQNEVILKASQDDLLARREIANSMAESYKIILDGLKANRVQCKFLNGPPLKFNVKINYDFEVYDPKIK